MKLLVRLYLAFATLVLVGWTATALAGKEPFAPRPKRLPPEARSAAGGPRTFHFWHSGYRGGK